MDFDYDLAKNMRQILAKAVENFRKLNKRLVAKGYKGKYIFAFNPTFMPTDDPLLPVLEFINKKFMKKNTTPQDIYLRLMAPYIFRIGDSLEEKVEEMLGEHARAPETRRQYEAPMPSAQPAPYASGPSKPKASEPQVPKPNPVYHPGVEKPAVRTEKSKKIPLKTKKTPNERPKAEPHYEPKPREPKPHETAEKGQPRAPETPHQNLYIASLCNGNMSQTSKAKEEEIKNSIDSFRAAWKDYSRAREVLNLAKEQKIKSDEKAYDNLIAWAKLPHKRSEDEESIPKFGEGIDDAETITEGAGVAKDKSDIANTQLKTKRKRILDDLELTKLANDWYATSGEQAFITGQSNLENIVEGVPKDNIQKLVMGLFPSQEAAEKYGELAPVHMVYSKLMALIEGQKIASSEAKEANYEGNIKKVAMEIGEARLRAIGTSNADKLVKDFKFFASISPGYGLSIIPEEAERAKKKLTEMLGKLNDKQLREYASLCSQGMAGSPLRESLYDSLYKALPKPEQPKSK